MNLHNLWIRRGVLPRPLVRGSFRRWWIAPVRTTKLRKTSKKPSEMLDLLKTLPLECDI